jgi:hypothetical protein
MYDNQYRCHPAEDFETTEDRAGENLFIFNISAAGGWLNERDRTFNARHIRIRVRMVPASAFPRLPPSVTSSAISGNTAVTATVAVPELPIVTPASVGTDNHPRD